MTRQIFLSLILMLAAASISLAEPALQCGLELYQNDPQGGADRLLMSDTVEIVQGIPASGYFLVASAEFELVQIDTARARFSVHLVTLGPPTHSSSRVFTVEYGLPARLSDIIGKNGASYDFAITPLAMVDVDTSLCPFTNRAESGFTFNPSANMDIYFLPSSFGDYYWGAVKGLLEDQYRPFAAMCGFNIPGKTNVFLCPCYLPSLIWDGRFAMAIDPTRRTSSVIYSRDFNSVDAFVVNQNALLRNWGYAPPLLSEGLAGINSPADIDMKKLIADGRAPKLANILDTYTYLSTDPFVADRTAASLAAYLVKVYGVAKFRKLYEAADDLNLAEKMAEVYERSVDEIEDDWRQYHDTLTVDPARIAYFGDIAESMFRYSQMLSYGMMLESYVRNHNDSLRWLSLVSRAAFYTGDYYQATEAQEKLVALDTGTAARLMTLATYREMNAYYDEAGKELELARRKDSTDQYVMFNLALNHLYRGDTTGAIDLLTQLVTVSSPMSPVAESRVMLAELLSLKPEAAGAEKRNQYLDEAIGVLAPAVKSDPSVVQSQLWLGVAYMLKGQSGWAQQHLTVADFLETRAFYRGLINLWLGKLADVSGDRKMAEARYGEVLRLPSADFVQREARQYLQKPYKLK